MLDYSNCALRFLLVHQVGSKFENQGVRCSVDFTDVQDEGVQDALIRLFFNPFKVPEYFQFASDAGLDHHPMYRYASEIFESPKNNLVPISEKIAGLLYDASENPNIKSGDVCIAYFGHVGSDGQHGEAIGVYKIEHVDTFLRFVQDPQSYSISTMEGLGLDKMDKACLILNQEQENGYKICCHSRSSNMNEALYWKEDFLGLEPRKDEYHQTEYALNLTKDFVTHQLGEEYDISKADQIALLNRSADYFKREEKFSPDQFAQDIFQDEGVINSFQQFTQDSEKSSGYSFTEDFDISEAAVKRNSKVFKSVLKLDKNFHVYIHGNRSMIERGVDENGKKFYKLFYDSEE